MISGGRRQDVFIDIENLLVFQVKKMPNTGDVLKLRVLDLTGKEAGVFGVHDRILLAVQDYRLALDLTYVNGVA